MLESAGLEAAVLWMVAHGTAVLGETPVYWTAVLEPAYWYAVPESAGLGSAVVFAAAIAPGIHAADRANIACLLDFCSFLP